MIKTIFNGYFKVFGIIAIVVLIAMTLNVEQIKLMLVVIFQILFILIAPLVFSIIGYVWGFYE